MDTVLCPSCGQNGIKRIGQISAVGEFAGRVLDDPLPGGCLYQCRSCFLQFRHPKLDKTALDKLYKQGNEENWQNTVEGRVDWNIASRTIQTHLKQGSVLDVGCFSGGFLSTLPEPFQCFGIEIHKFAAREAEKAGVRIIGDDFAALASNVAVFDVVVAMDVIEHVEDPLVFLKMIVAATRPGGLIIISTGNTQAPSWRLMGSLYWYCTVAEHIVFICPQWCEHVARVCGVRVEQIEHFSHLGKDQRTIVRRLKELVRNLFFRMMPKCFAWLRSAGFGKTDVSSHPSLKYYPPGWMSAKDHFVAVLRKEE